MTNQELHAHIARIKQSLASPTTCTSATAEALSSILTPNSSTVPHKANPGAYSQKQNARLPVARGASGPAARSKKKLEVAILEIQEPEEGRLDPTGRFKLAMEVVNITLKQLTEALKTPVMQKPRRRLPLNRTSSESQSRGPSNPGSPVPLQPRSVNRVTSVASGSSCSRRSSCADQSEQATSILALAECARTALATLRALESSGSTEFQMPSLQLEAGMSAFIGKLVALGMDEIAVKELRILTKRISAQGAEGESLVKRTMIDLLHINHVPSDPQTVSLIVTTQLQILKLLVVKKRGFNLETAYKYLRLSNPGSPANLLDWLVASPSPEFRTKALRQMETLAQLLLSLCQVDATETGRIPNASVAFQYQILALQLRGKWWKLAGHKVDKEKELLNPFVRYLNAFVQSTVNVDEELFSFVRSTVDNLSETVEFMLVPSILQILSDLASKCKNFSNAIRYSNLLLTAYNNSNASKARVCGVLCRLAKLQLQLGDLKDEKSTDETLKMLLNAVKALKGNLTGDSSDLDELLIQFTSLRKKCLSYLHSNHEVQAYETVCLELVLLGSRFLIRYVGERPAVMATKGVEDRFLKRLGFARRVILSTVEAIASLAKLSLADNAVVWKTIDMALQDCVSLLSNFDISDLSEKTSPNVSSPKDLSSFSLLSNAYWCHYLKQKSVCPKLEDLRSCLQKSIDLIIERPILEKRAAFLPTKLVKLAEIYEQCKQTREAKATYVEALKAQMAMGSLRIAAECAASNSVAQIFGYDSGTSMLAKLLERYIILTCRTVPDEQSIQYFDDDQLCDQERGILLEYQSRVLSSAMPVPRTHMWTSALREISSTLLNLYDEDNFPVRRLRVVVRILQVHALHHASFDPVFIGNILTARSSCDLLSLGCDSGLKKYLTHLHAFREVLSTMVSSPPNPKDLDGPLRIWSELIEDAKLKTVLLDQIDDTDDWLHCLEDIAEYVYMQGREKQRLSVLQLTATIHGLIHAVNDPACVSNLIALSLQYTRLGHSRDAGEVLQKVREHLSNDGTPLHMSLRWHIAYSEYLADTGNLVKSEEHIQKATELLADVTATREADSSYSNKGLSKIWVSAEIAHIRSLLNETKGHISASLFYAKKSVRFSQRLWTILDRRIGAGITHRTQATVPGATRGSSTTSILEAQDLPIASRTHASLQRAELWSLVPDLICRLRHLSKIFSHCGLYPDARYYAEQALRVADAVGATPYQSQLNIIIGNYEVRCGKLDNGLSRILKSMDTVGEQSGPYASVVAQLTLASALAKTGDTQAEEEALASAKIMAAGTIPTDSAAEEVHHVSDSLGDLSVQMHKLNIKSRSSRTQHSKSRAPVVSIKVKKSRKPASTKVSTDSLAAQPLAFRRLRASVLREESQSALRMGNLEVSRACLSEAGSIPVSQQDMVDHALALAQLSLKEGLYQISKDPVFSVLSDSTMSCPSVALAGRRRSKDHLSTIKLPEPGPKATRSRSQPTTKAGSRLTSPKPSQFSEHLQKALAAIHTICNIAQLISSSSRVHLLSSILFKIVMMLSTTATPVSQGNVSPMFGLYAMELGRCVAAIKNSSIITIEKLLAVDEDSDGHSSETNHSIVDLVEGKVDIASFQADYIDIIPTSWNVISISLSEDFKELRLAKLRTAQTPFMLAMPLDRHCSRNGEDEIFGFDEGKSELLDIIDLSNHSAHEAKSRDMSKKGAKTEWWEARAALDNRLRDLVRNIETIWLGGFRGIFAKEAHRHDLLARFQKSFSNILNKHLPSRRKPGTASASVRVAVDTQVLELFVNLGNPAEVDDLDEPIMDLLYFVVDVLQFGGERNAYDEIDFDAIAVETLDTLTHYHQAARDRSEDVDTHTILILDKSIHCFPWESLPCLSGRSVSRLPSLTHLRERILQQCQQDSQNNGCTDSGYHVDPSDGAYILNPAGDLTSTQKLFQKPLESLSSWSATMNRTPSEMELEASLSTRSIYLYFGHGSGSQYISSRAVRKLDRCAVALLMGCSSGTMTEEGEYESHGVPLTYLQAGAQAVVGTLWDVTDKDIDRFSMSVLENWGLFEHGSAIQDRSPIKEAKGKSKARAELVAMPDAEQRPQKQAMSLDQAIAKGRKACFLKYLNGAAPVMYGTPVFLRSSIYK
ncbi:hypothetical protein MMC26_007122 [Xylographa opegraphella]|nr:hypothetical protein [Xylographa opegraphella]